MKPRAIPSIGTKATGGRLTRRSSMRIEPKPRDTGVEFTQSLSGQNVDRCVRALSREGDEGLRRGYSGECGSSTSNRLYDGKMHRRFEGHRFPNCGYFGLKKLSRWRGLPARTDPPSRSEFPKIAGKGRGRLVQPSARQGMDGRQLPAHQGPRRQSYRYSSTLRPLRRAWVHSETFNHYEDATRCRSQGDRGKQKGTPTAGV